SFIYSMKNLHPAIASLYAYINPIVAVFLGWALLHETVYAGTLLATALTLLGVYLVNRGYSSSK
ncbi:MAG: EamA family transporter, partial [Cytophagales bacterium]|nr:EamA family transporter [Cytophagales bacterium]